MPEKENEVNGRDGFIMTDNPDILLSDEFRRSVEANLDRDPVRIALDKSVPDAALVASQVKYLRRAEHKLPSYYSAQCVLPARAFEQSSSETAAARKNYSGRLCIDLTCGLGVDSLYLSHRFEKVIAIERDAGLAAIARENFRRLGAHNIEVVNTSAEEFLARFDAAGSGTGPGRHADLIYADPDRRGADGKKLVRIEDCSPDIVALLPVIQRVSTRLVVKLSPLFDVDEVFRIFGGRDRGGMMPDPHTSVRVEVVSFGGECKEIIAEVTANENNKTASGSAAATIAQSTVCAVAIGLGEVCYPFENRNAPEQSFEPERYRWLIVPDVALQKARLARRYFSEYGERTGDVGIRIDSDNGYGFAAEKPGNILGRVFEITSIEPFDPKALKRRLKADGIKNVDIMKRDFPLSAADIARRIGVREGGTHTIAFTRAAGKLWQIAIRP